MIDPRSSDDCSGQLKRDADEFAFRLCVSRIFIAVGDPSKPGEVFLSTFRWISC